MKRNPAVAAAVLALAAYLFPSVARPKGQQLPAQSRVTVLPLVHRDAAWAARKLTALPGKNDGVRIFADEATNAVLIRANATNVRRAREVLRWVDVAVELHVIRLKHADATGAA